MFSLCLTLKVLTNMLLQLLFLLLNLIPNSEQVNAFSKCCPDNFKPHTEENNTIICEKMPNWNYQFWSAITNLVNKNEFGECVDVEKNLFHLYKFNNSMLISKKQFTPPHIFPKCCPLNHLYNNITRGCQPTEIAETFLDIQFIKVALPDCKTQLIIDSTFDNYTDAKAEVFNMNENNYCFDQNENSEIVLRKCSRNLKICKLKQCLKKCCPDGQSYHSEKCVNSFIHGLSIENQHYSSYIENTTDYNDYEIIYGVGCQRVRRLEKNDFQSWINKLGEIKFYSNYTSRFETEPFNNFYTYCLEHSAITNKYHMYWCSQPILEQTLLITMPAKILSCVCLFVTIIVYVVLDEHKTTFGKIVINYCFAVGGLLTILTISHYRTLERLSETECKLEGYLLVFFNVSTYTWINLMSMYIWWSFGTLKRASGTNQRKKSLKKFLLHLMYGWGVPLIHILLLLAFDKYPVLPHSIQPYVGIFRCSLESRQYSKILFLLVPQVLFQTANIILFIKTIEYYIRVKNEIKIMKVSSKNSKYNDTKGKFVLVVKLAIIMGITWTREVIGAFFEGKEVYNQHIIKFENFLDFITCLQGVFIFVIFLCKKKMLIRIANKIRFRSRVVFATIQLRSSTQRSD